MSIPSVTCPACGAADCGPTMDYRAFPAFLFPMAEEIAGVIESQNLSLHLCAGCGHLFQAEGDPALLSQIYGRYYANYPYDGDEAMNQAYRRPFHLFFDLMLDTHAVGPAPRLLEIGCSRPGNMLPFAEKGYDCVGIDPSPLAEGADVPEGIRIVSGYYEETPLEGKFDIVVSRFNLEHITDLSAHLIKMSQDLREGGRIIVQVPNVAYYLENLQPLFVAHEHIHYFSQHSLVRLFERHGFATVACYSAGQPSVLACFEKRAPGARQAGEPVAALVEEYKANIATKAKELTVQLADKQRVVLYGCGLALYWVLTVLRGRLPSQIVVVDDNPILVGKAIPLHLLPIRRPDPDLLADADLVVLTLNPIYHDGVIARLRKQGCLLTLLKIGRERLERELLP